MKYTALLLTVLSMASFVVHQNAGAGQAPVNLGKAGNFAILAKTGISTVPPSAITGDIGVSPIDSTAVTGFSPLLDSTTRFSTSSQVTGKIYAPDYASPTPVNLTTAVGDMQTAATDAAGRLIPDFTELGTGNIGGLTLTPGLYKWGTGVTIPANVTISGTATDVWIFQIAGNITMAGSKSVFLAGGAQAKNIFWQVSGGAGVDIGTGAHFEGIILADKGINMQTGASINGRLLSQTAVTLDSSTVTIPSGASVVLQSSSVVTGLYTDAVGQSINLSTKTITVPLSGTMKFYRITAYTEFKLTSLTINGGNVVITYN
jgi:hypothetical protein